MAARGCRRPRLRKDDELCFCPPAGMGYGPRQVLAQKFINGWVGKQWMDRANSRAADESVTEAELWELLWEIEDHANDAYAMWRNTL